MYVSEFMNGGRIVSHGEIQTLKKGFKLCEGCVPFSIYLVKKQDSAQELAVLNVKCMEDTDFAEAPFYVNEWTPCAITEIAPDETDAILTNYRLFWGAGTGVNIKVYTLRDAE